MEEGSTGVIHFLYTDSVMISRDDVSIGLSVNISQLAEVLGILAGVVDQVGVIVNGWRGDYVCLTKSCFIYIHDQVTQQCP